MASAMICSEISAGEAPSAAGGVLELAELVLDLAELVRGPA